MPRITAPTSPAPRTTPRASPSPRAFTLVELLVVVGLIAVLVGLLIPVVGRVRRAGYAASTQALVAKLQASIERYYQDFNAYPGTLPDSAVPGASGPYVGTDFPSSGFAISTLPTGFNVSFPAANNFPATTPNSDTSLNAGGYQSITGTNNLVLALLGGLYYDTSGVGLRVKYDPSLVGKGPASLNPATLKTYPPYADLTDVLWSNYGGSKNGHFQYEGSVDASDSPIPSFVDKYPDPLPLLYLRARPGATRVAWYSLDTSAANLASPGQYDLAHVIGYTTTPMGGAAQLKAAGRSNTTPGRHGLTFIDTNGTYDTKPTSPKVYYYPYEFSTYVQQPGSNGAVRSKDGFLLISAGPDRIYGTDDDQASFGSVK